MEYEYWLQHLQLYGIGPQRRRALRQAFGSAKEVYMQSKAFLEKVKGISETQAEWIVNSRTKWRLSNYEKMQKEGIHFITEEMEAYPKRLLHLPDRPDGLFYKGCLPKDEAPSIAIVGARNCTNYGRVMATSFARELAVCGVQIVSGLACGIDGYAHQGSLDVGGSTFGVLGCGVDVCYPRTHIGMYMDIQRKGGILSEYPPKTQPIAKHFPLRNRIISGLADTVLVVEAKEKSGSLITADFALEQGRDVFAVPGRLDDNNSKGCNRLILQGAGIAFSPEELIKQLGLDVKKQESISKNINFSLAREEKLVYSCLGLHPKERNTIVEEVNLPVSKVLSVLLTLQLKGYITETDRAYYCRNPQFTFLE